jgi:hypothetical protein
MAVQTPHNFVTVQPITLGWIIAVLVLILAAVLMIVGMLDIKLGLLICGLAVARLI